MLQSQGYLRHIQACNQYRGECFLPLSLDGERVGRVRPAFAGQLLRFPEIFSREQGDIVMRFDSVGLEHRSLVLASALQQLVEEGHISHLHGEQYAVTAGSRDQAGVLLDRAAAPYFGIRAFGQHINGIVERDGETLMWLGRRADDRLHFPGCLDQIAAGGLPYGISLLDNLEKECWEEAGIEPGLARQAEPVGQVNYFMETDKGFKPDTLFCYDLRLPEDFQPLCTDGEVAEFILLPVTEVARLVRDTDQFKLNCNLVVIDFLLRHGWIKPDDPDYAEIALGLRPQIWP